MGAGKLKPKFNEKSSGCVPTISLKTSETASASVSVSRLYVTCSSLLQSNTSIWYKASDRMKYSVTIKYIHLMTKYSDTIKLYQHSVGKVAMQRSILSSLPLSTIMSQKLQIILHGISMAHHWPRRNIVSMPLCHNSLLFGERQSHEETPHKYTVAE